MTELVLNTADSLTEQLGAVATLGSVTDRRYSRGWGGELAREVSSGGGLAWYLGDRLGSVRAGYDNAGATGLRLDYDPFGEPEAGTGLGTPQNAVHGGLSLQRRSFAPGRPRR